MKPHTNFTPGPSQLYFTAADHARQAFRDGIPSISHRSKRFEEISHECTGGLRELLGIPAAFHIFFTGSATEIWERAVQNLVGETSQHYVNGSFSKRFHEIAVQLHRKAEKVEVPEGKGFDTMATTAAEMIALTHNETSTGVWLPLSLIEEAKRKNPDSLVVVDAVSSLPYPAFNFRMLDSVFFSVQKGFGLPAGLGVWIVNDKCIAKAEQLLSQGKSIGSYHSLPTLLANAKKNQTPETPNVLGLYLLNNIVKDFLRRDIKAIRQETDYKAALLYHTLDHHPLLSAFVTEPSARSKTVIVAECGTHTEKISTFLQAKGLYPGDGYGNNKKTQLRFANFPAHSKEQYEFLADSLKSYQG